MPREARHGCRYFSRYGDLKVHFPPDAACWAVELVVKAVDRASFDIRRGRTFGIVGESGSGKSTTALGRHAPAQDHGRAGRSLAMTDIGALQGEALRRVRKRFQMVFQDPFASLNPRKRAGDAIQEALDLMDVGAPAERAQLARQLFLQTGLRPEQLSCFPTSSQAVNASALCSHARWRRGRNFWSVTNRCPHWMWPLRRRSSTSCAGCRMSLV
jgi:ABC-type glutathione transport system ATPase component